MPALGEALRALQHALAEVGVGWYVFGAQAVAVRGVARATQDVDVTLSAVPDVDRLLVALHANGFRHRFPDIAAELLRDGAVLPMVHAAGMEADLVLGGTEIEELAVARATLERVDGARVPVAAAVDLVISKRARLDDLARPASR